MIKNVFNHIDLSSFITGSTEHTWTPKLSTETNIPSYWLNWRFFLCAIFVLTSLFLSSFLIWRYEGHGKRKKRGEEVSVDVHSGEEIIIITGVVYDEETWKTCCCSIHENWLLGFRVFGFVVLLGLIFGNAVNDGTGIFIFYTQWTFTLVTIYFGLAALVSINRFRSIDNGRNIASTFDEEQASYRPPPGDYSNVLKPTNRHERQDMTTRRVAATLGYIHQILFQTCAGAVLLTDGVFWFIIYPFLTSKDFNLDFFIVVMHTVNAVFLLGETLLNSLRFPLFRIAYFVAWTGVFVLFQWIVHACVSFWWPYPFLDLSSSSAPLWYGAVGLMHIPCFGIFALIVKLKYLCLSQG
ncbi:unnamed protein product [Cochlearia groenlandica]